jgi:toxin ParE1/3/4
MARVVVTEPADADTAEIQAYVEREAGIPTASKYSNSFESLYERLTAHPDSGAPRPALGRHVRIGIVAPYVVIYRHVADDDVVAIIRVVHGSRRITRKLLRGAS